MALAENQIQKEILQSLLRKGFFVWRQNQVHVKGRTFIGKKGLGDIIGVLPCGRFFSIEVKTDTGKVSVDQHKFIMDTRTNNGIAIVARSKSDVEKLNCSRSCSSVQNCTKYC